jgi:shikimate kinase
VSDARSAGGGASAHHVVLVGMMGSGKTTVGRRVAAVLGRRFADSDEIIEARTGRTVAEIFAGEGEPAFRAIETEVLAECLAVPEPTVVAAAGGVVLEAENRRRLVGAGTVVWLKVPVGTLVVRVAGSTHRPLLDDDAERVLAELSEEREALYLEVADLTLDASQPLDDVVGCIIDLVHQRELRVATEGSGGPVDEVAT